MLTNNLLRSRFGLLAIIAFALLVALNLAGCSSEDSVAPVTGPEAPVLPDAAELSFDFSFFDNGAEMEKAANGHHTNFVNAYLRAILLEAMAELALVAPVSAFGAALQTVPEAQEDGAWIWTYDYYGYRYPIRVALRGLPAVDHVAWELRIGPGGEDPTLVWFEGQTSGDGEQGQWLFYDLDDEAHPLSGEIAWGDDEVGRYLQFTSREPGSDGDTLRFNDADPNFAITFVDETGDDECFIRWHADGTGSLRVPDYNEGLEACWDQWQENVICQ